MKASTLHTALGVVLLLLALAAYGVLQAYAFQPQLADEGIYHYGAKRWSEGAWPYRDLFFAHPPLHLAPQALIYWMMGGFSWTLAKAWPSAAGAMSIVAVYAGLWHALRNLSATARLAGSLSAAVLLLFSDGFLVAAAFDTGMSQAVALLGLAALALVHRKGVAAGVLTAAAVMTLIQVFPIAVGLGACAFVLGKTTFRHFAIASASALLIVHTAAFVIAGRAFFDSVYFFHMAKKAAAGEGLDTLFAFLLGNQALLVIAAVGAVFACVLKPRARKAVLIGSAAMIVHVVFVASRPRVYLWYFQPAALVAALLAGVGIGCLVASPLKRWTRVALVTVAGLILFPVAPSWALRSESMVPLGVTWRDAPQLGSINRIVKALLWKPQRTGAPDEANARTRFLWGRVRFFTSLPAVVESVQSFAAQHAHASLFGHSVAVPTVALAAGVPIMDDLIDTNLERFRAGHLDVAYIIRQLDAAPFPLVLISERSGVGTLPTLRSYLEGQFRQHARFDAGRDSLVLYVRR